MHDDLLRIYSCYGSEKEKFYVGDEFETTCIFTGGYHFHKIVKRENNRIFTSSIYHELDGDHNVEEEYDVYIENGIEYIVTWKYKGEEGRLYANEIRR